MFFLAGLPRSGNTVLAALLNQHPEIYCSPQSPLLHGAWQLKKSLYENEHTQRHQDYTIVNNAIKGLFTEAYKNIQKPYIIDREKVWGVPKNFQFIKDFLTPEPKIICTVRDIVSILASFITVVSEHPSFYVDLEMLQADINPLFRLSRNDARCDWLMKPDGGIEHTLQNLYTALSYEGKFFHLVEYDDLINQPQETMNGIYTFLNIKSFDHDFNNIKKIESDYESPGTGFPPNLHKVRPKLAKESLPVEEVLSEYIIKKYSNMEFWRNNGK